MLEPILPKRWGVTEIAIVFVMSWILTGPVSFICLECMIWLYCWHKGVLP
jgi:hypothetical protein